MGTDPVVEGGEDLATDLRHETTIGDRPYQTPPSVADRPWTPMMGTDLVVEGGEDSATDLRRPPRLGTALLLGGSEGLLRG
jgi:hypothetical protein